MALICPNGHDTVSPFFGSKVQCLICGVVFDQATNEAVEHGPDKPEKLTQDEEIALSPQVSSQVAAGTTSATGAAFEPSAESVTTTGDMGVAP